MIRGKAAPACPLRNTSIPPPPAARIRELARRVGCLGRGSRHGCTERFIVEKITIQRELEGLATRIERAGGGR
jgi:hypothetical protein